ncbi:hypothetical protein [Chryseobacterium sp. Marseille-Q8038]
MENIEFHQPEFLLCEKSMPDYDRDGEIEYEILDSKVEAYEIKDERLWVYHLKSESLIEFLYMNGREAQNFTSRHKDFVYENENYTGFFVKNNTKNLGQDENIVLDKAWAFLEAKFNWDREYYYLDEV